VGSSSGGRPKEAQPALEPEGIRNGADEDATGPQDPARFGDERVGELQVLEKLAHDDSVEARICEGERARVGVLEAQLDIAHRVEASRGDREHALADIGTDDRAVRRGTGGQLR